MIDGATIVAKSYVTFDPDSIFDTERQIQANGVDLRLMRVKHVSGRAALGRDQRLGAAEVQINEIPAKDGWFDLHHSSGNYLVDFYESISVPDGFCAKIITRSSLVRVGVDVMAGLYDTGFNGRLGGSLRLKNPIQIQVGACMAQITFHECEFNGHRYAGFYQGTTQSEFK